MRGFRSILAGLIAIGAVIVFIPGLVNFVGRARTEYQWDGVSVSNGALLALTEAVAMPVMLFGIAVIAEMLFRIAEALPAGSGGTSVTPPARYWRHPFVVVLLVGATLSGALGVVAGLAAFFASNELGLSFGQRLDAAASHLLQTVVTTAEIVALAAIVEYLSRICAKRDAA